MTHPELSYTIALIDDVWDDQVFTSHRFDKEWDSWLFWNENTHRILVVKDYRLQYFDLSPVATDDPGPLGVEP